MAERKTGKFLVPAQGGPMRSFVNRLKLITRLMGDGRVNIFLKLLPVASLGYLILPADLIPVIPFLSALDDAAVLWLGTTLFVELCPDEVVQEHKRAIEGPSQDISEEIVDAESTDVDDK